MDIYVLLLLFVKEQISGRDGRLADSQSDLPTHTHVYTHTHTHTQTHAHPHTNTHNQRYLKWSICKSTQTGQCLDSSLDLLIAKAPWFTAWVKKYKWRKDAYITHMYNQWRDLRLKYKIHTAKSVFISQVFISSDGQLAEHYTRSVSSPGSAFRQERSVMGCLRSRLVDFNIWSRSLFQAEFKTFLFFFVLTFLCNTFSRKNKGIGSVCLRCVWTRIE